MARGKRLAVSTGDRQADDRRIKRLPSNGRAQTERPRSRKVFLGQRMASGSALACLAVIFAVGVGVNIHLGHSKESNEKPASSAADAGRGNIHAGRKSKSEKTDSQWSGHKLTPEFVSELVGLHYSNELSREVKRAVLDRRRHLEMGKNHAKKGEWHNATRQFRHILEHDPFDEEAQHLLHNCYQRMYPTGPQGSRTINFTEQLFTVIDRQLRQGWMLVHGRNISIRLLHPELRAYVLENFLSKSECAGLIGEHDRIAGEYGVYPLICFQNTRFLEHPHLKELYIPGTYCLNQAASRAVGPYLNWSTSASCHRGESGLAYHIEDRVEQAVGLPEAHGFNMQLLSYIRGVSYNDHTDCEPDKCNILKLERVATFLAYLTSTAGGDLSFPRLGVNVKPECGRAVVFYSFTPNGCCDPKSTHRSNVILATEAGRKMAVQKWYTYPNVPFLAERAQAPRVRGRLPYQPIVSCDYVLDGAEPSCRWYDFWPFSNRETHSN